MRVLQVLVGSCLLSACVRHVPLANTSLSARFRQTMETPTPLSAASIPSAKGLHFLFVGGFLNEGIPGYFVDNMAVVTEELGATASVIFPKSADDLEEDAAGIRDEVISLSDQLQRPVVLVGHSKGGAGVVLAALKYPELIRGGRVVDVISIQGAIHGSPIADAMTESLPIPLLHQKFKGLTALTRKRADGAFRSAPMAGDLTDWYRDHLFFVRSSESTGVVAAELQLSHAFLTRFGPNDGLLCEGDQLLGGVGRDLGVLRADHGALTVTAPISGFTADTRRAFTRALLFEVFERRAP